MVCLKAYSLTSYVAKTTIAIVIMLNNITRMLNLKALATTTVSGAPNDNFRKNICSEDDLGSRIFETFVVKFLACLPLLGFSNV